MRHLVTLILLQATGKDKSTYSKTGLTNILSDIIQHNNSDENNDGLADYFTGVGWGRGELEKEYNH